MTVPVETQPPAGPGGGTGEPPAGAPAQEPPAPPAGSPEPPPAPGAGQPGVDGLPGQPGVDGVITSGRGSNQDRTPETPAAPASSPSPQAQPDPATPPAGGSERQEVSDLPQWAQDLIASTRDESAKARVNAKTQAAEEARKALTQDIAKALGIVTDDTPPEDQLSPEQLRDLLSGERTTARMARTELAVYRAAQSAQANGGGFNAAALLDSRAFLDSIKDVDPTDGEALATKIAEAVQANPWLAAPQQPAEQPPAAPAASAAPPAPAPVVVPPSGGQFAGGPGAQSQDLNEMSIDDFRKMRRSRP